MMRDAVACTAVFAVTTAVAIKIAARRRKKKTADLIDGKKIAQSIRKEVAEGVIELVSTTGVRPGLAVVWIGDRRDSEVYVRNKKRAAEEVGFWSLDIKLASKTSEAEVIATIQKLNADPKIHSILVQLPLPAHIDSAKVLKQIAVEKDADGFSALNVGNMCLRGGDAPMAIPCTPNGCIELLKRSGVQIAGARAVVIGRSNIVGMPCFVLLQSLNATVTLCHSHTIDLPSYVREADIIVAAVGVANFVKGHWIKPGAVVLDAGINHVADPTAKRGYRLVGDVDFKTAQYVASKITPVPGGVGPMTIAMLTRNTLDLARQQAANHQNTSAAWNSLACQPETAVTAPATLTPLPEDFDAKSMMVRDDGSICNRRQNGITRKTPIPPDIEISQSVEPLPIAEVACSAGLLPEEFFVHGKYKAKINAEAVHSRLGGYKRRGSLCVVTGINPTKFGEGKSTTTIGVCQALGNSLGKQVITTIRQPSQGPMFGIKGGAAGGGYSQVIPMEEMNSHLTGDIHAVVAANNLVAAALDARIFHERTQKDAALFNRLCPIKDGVRPLAAPLRDRLKRLGVTCPDKLADAENLDTEQRTALVRLDIDPETITWKRVLDTCDRFLRKVEIGRNSTEKGQTRETGFDIAVASEIMAVLSLARDAADLRRRLGAMTVAKSKKGNNINCDDLGVTGALVVLLKDALMPTLMQTLEATPVLVHCGPFANIAHGNSSVIADRLALQLVGDDGFVVTEAGFGTDIGGEKNFDIKARVGDLEPNCVVVVATVRALKSHATEKDAVPDETNLDKLARGCANVEHHVRCVTQQFGLPCIVAVNRFATDTNDEIALVCEKCLRAGATAAVQAEHFAKGGDGAIELANAVVDACAPANRHSTFRFLYPLDVSIHRKLWKICAELYLAGSIEYSETAKAQLSAYEQDDEVNAFPICVAKTQYSISTNPDAKGAPSGHTFYVRELVPRYGAGFLIVIAGDIMTIPGLPTRPNYYDIDLDTMTGKVVGLS